MRLTTTNSLRMSWQSEKCQEHGSAQPNVRQLQLQADFKCSESFRKHSLLVCTSTEHDSRGFRASLSCFLTIV